MFEDKNPRLVVQECYNIQKFATTSKQIGTTSVYIPMIKKRSFPASQPSIHQLATLAQVISTLNASTRNSRLGELAPVNNQERSESDQDNLPNTNKHNSKVIPQIQ